MSAKLERRFTCDRCGTEATLAVQNTPVAARDAPPEGWRTVVVVTGLDDARPHHLCGACAPGLDDFMANRRE